MKCEIVDFEKADFRELDSFADRTVFQTREWVRFVAETQAATPVLARLTDSGKLAGYFTGLTFTRFGVKVLGSSFPGWTTSAPPMRTTNGKRSVPGPSVRRPSTTNCRTTSQQPLHVLRPGR